MKNITLKNSLAFVGALSILIGIWSFTSKVVAEQSGTDDHKYYLMIAQPNDAAWKGVIEAGGDMSEPAGKAIEAMGGKLHSYYIGVNEAKNYGVVSFPSSHDIAKIVYMRTIQGLMKEIKFIEIMPSDQAATLFEDVKKLTEKK